MRRPWEEDLAKLGFARLPTYFRMIESQPIRFALSPLFQCLVSAKVRRKWNGDSIVRVAGTSMAYPFIGDEDSSQQPLLNIYANAEIFRIEDIESPKQRRYGMEWGLILKAL